MYKFSNISKLSKISELVPEPMKYLDKLEEATFSEGALTAKTKELMAVAVALTTQCSYCIEYHRRAAIKAGATEEELAETVMVAVAMKAGSAATHGTHLFLEKS